MRCFRWRGLRRPLHPAAATEQSDIVSERIRVPVGMRRWQALPCPRALFGVSDALFGVSGSRIDVRAAIRRGASIVFCAHNCLSPRSTATFQIGGQSHCRPGISDAPYRQRRTHLGKPLPPIADGRELAIGSFVAASCGGADRDRRALRGRHRSPSSGPGNSGRVPRASS